MIPPWWMPMPPPLMPPMGSMGMGGMGPLPMPPLGPLGPLAPLGPTFLGPLGPLGPRPLRPLRPFQAGDGGAAAGGGDAAAEDDGSPSPTASELPHHRPRDAREYSGAPPVRERLDMRQETEAGLLTAVNVQAMPFCLVSHKAGAVLSLELYEFFGVRL